MQSNFFCDKCILRINCFSFCDLFFDQISDKWLFNKNFNICPLCGKRIKIDCQCMKDVYESAISNPKGNCHSGIMQAVFILKHHNRIKIYYSEIVRPCKTFFNKNSEINCWRCFGYTSFGRPFKFLKNKNEIFIIS